MKITLTYLAFTMFLYSLIVFGLMGPEFENVKESWFLIMLFTDVPKVNYLFTMINFMILWKGHDSIVVSKTKNLISERQKTNT